MVTENQSLFRGFSLIEYLSGCAAPQALKDISSACSLPPPTAYRLLNSLSLMGYVEHRQDGKYVLSHKLFFVSSRVVTESGLVSEFKPFLDRLSDELQESVHLVLQDGMDVLYIYKNTKSRGSIQMASHVGMKMPMYRTAVGKAIIADMPDKEISRLFMDQEFKRTTSKSIASFSELMAQISIIRTFGYAVDDEENEENVKCIAAHIGTFEDNASYAFSVSSLKNYMTEERTQMIIRKVLSTKDEILNKLGLKPCSEQSNC